MMSSEEPRDTTKNTQNQEIWIASEKYLRGEIKVDELEEAELFHSENLEQATDRFHRQANIDSRIRYFLTVSTGLLFLLGIVAYLITGDQFLLAISALAIIPFRGIMGHYF